MRMFGFLASFGVLVLMTVALVEGQQPQPKKGGGGGGGFGGGNIANNPLALLNNKDVKKELDITDEQSAKVPAEVMVAISKVLNEKQFKRFKQIQLQQRGNNAFADADIQKQLNLNADQKKNIGEIVETSNKDLAELKGAFGGFGKGKGGAGGAGGNAEKSNKIRTEATEKILNVLTADQKKTWNDMTGPELKITTGFGGGAGGGFGKKGAKKDTDK
jgi:hypothetical protein